MKKLFIVLIFSLFLFSCSDLNNTVSNNNTKEKNNYLSFLSVIPPRKTVYKVGEDFDSTGMSIIAYYSDSSSKNVTDAVSIFGFDSSKAEDNQTITISYSEKNKTKTSSFYISIKKMYKIIFHSNNGTNEQIIQNVLISENEQLKTNSFNFDNHYFYKWNTKPDGKGTNYKESEFLTEITFENSAILDLYAQWLDDSPIIITKENYQTVFNSLQNISEKKYLFYCIDDLTDEIFTTIKNAIYNLYATKICLDFSVLKTAKIFLNFSDRDYSSLLTVLLPKECAFRFGDGNSFCCKNLRYVKLPESTKYIYAYAFYGCEALTSISLPNDIEEIWEAAFCNCKSLKEISIPNSVISLGHKVFYNCEQLESLSLGNKIQSIGEEAFRECKKLKTINIPEGVLSINYESFYDCESLESILLPNSLTKICSYAFRNCISLKSVTMGNNVNKIESSAFYNCSNLESLSLSEGLSSLSSDIFSGCTNLKSLIIPDRITELPIMANCPNLQYITIGSGIKTIYSKTFSNCQNLKEVTFTTYSNWILSKTGVVDVNISSTVFSNKALIATYLKDTYLTYTWKKNE